MSNKRESAKHGTWLAYLRVKKKLALYILAGVASVLILAGGSYGYLYASTPSHIRKPSFEHYHFRTQIIVNGKPVNFAAKQFQQHYDATSCSTEVGGHPIDFHDEVDQMTHVHWQGMTGGEFLKYFGWNFIGGDDDIMGRRFDQGFGRMPAVKRFGDLLPDISKSANFYIYVGDKDSYRQKDWGAFLQQDLEKFFGKQSSVGEEQAAQFNLGNWLFPKAFAHGDRGNKADKHDGDAKVLSEEELKRINNLLGNVVIFVQEKEPTKEQIQARFNNLVPLSDSTCGG